jgi:hypothetical protein
MAWYPQFFDGPSWVPCSRARARSVNTRSRIIARRIASNCRTRSRDFQRLVHRSQRIFTVDTHESRFRKRQSHGGIIVKSDKKPIAGGARFGLRGVCALRNHIDPQRIEKPKNPRDVLYSITRHPPDHESRLSIADAAGAPTPSMMHMTAPSAK